MSSIARKKQIEFGDFQTPDSLATAVCTCLQKMGIQPDAVIEPTCGVGAFVVAATERFPQATIYGFELNAEYLLVLEQRVQTQSKTSSIQLQQADFFNTQWQPIVNKTSGSLLVLGNFPWVTNSVQGEIGGNNLPRKANFQQHHGLEAITGKANFDISEWMLLEVCRWLVGRKADVAMLVKTAVARKVLAHVQHQGLPLVQGCIFKIDAKKSFNVAVDACLLVMCFEPAAETTNEYWVFASLDANEGQRIGHRMGLSIADLDNFEKYQHLLGTSPQKWRSGIKHDAAAVMELSKQADLLLNGYGERVDIEPNYLFPLMKGSDIGSAKGWRNKYLLVTQRYVGETTESIRTQAPKTWDYLQQHAAILGARASSIYLKNPPFSIFGVGDYAFRPWRLAICGLYKNLNFQIIAPHSAKPVMFDDTVYYLSFNTEQEAQKVLLALQSDAAQHLLTALIFWDEKRPIKASILNLLDWSSLIPDSVESTHQLTLDVLFNRKGI